MTRETIFAVVFSSACALAAEPNSPPAPAGPPAPTRPSVATAPSVAPPTARTGVNPAPRQKKTPASFTRDMPLSEAIDILRNATTPPLNIVVYWKDLRTNAEIYRETPIGFDGLPGLRLGQSLEILLTSLSATSPTRIDYTVDHGVIVIATANALPVRRRASRVYDITDLAAPPIPWIFSPMFNTMIYNPFVRRPLGTTPGSTTSNR